MKSFADFFQEVQKSGFYRKRLEKFLDFVNPQLEMRALDVGCGPGALTIELAKRVEKAVGTDHNPQMITYAERNARAAKVTNIEFGIARAESLPFEEETFELVTATSVLYLLAEPQVGLREIVRVLKAGGIIANFDPSVKMTHKRIGKFAREQDLSEFEWDALCGWLSAATNNYKFSENSLKQLYRSSNLEIIEIAEHMDGMVLFCKGTKAEKTKEIPRDSLA